jgi:hypothetical protein
MDIPGAPAARSGQTGSGSRPVRRNTARTEMRAGLQVTAKNKCVNYFHFPMQFIAHWYLGLELKDL